MKEGNAISTVPEPATRANADWDVLDCIAVNLAVLLRRAGLPDTSTALCSQWTFMVDGRERWPVPVLEHTRREVHVERVTGLACRAHDLALDQPVEEIDHLLQTTGGVLVYADAYWLPWLPMYGRQHVEHSAAVTKVTADMVDITDAYTAATEWGDASYIETRLPREVLARAIRDSRGEHRHRAVTVLPRAGGPVADACALLSANVRAVRETVVAGRAIARFAEAYSDLRGDVDQWRAFDLSCWMVARARAAHARWLSRLTGTDRYLVPQGLVDGFDRLARDWQRTSQLAYLNRRKVVAGRSGTAGVAGRISADLQTAEVRLCEQLADHLDPYGPHVPTGSGVSSP